LWLHNCYQKDGRSIGNKIAQGLWKLSKFVATHIAVNQALCYQQEDGKYVFKII
jgi:hypothetical protein